MHSVKSKKKQHKYLSLLIKLFINLRAILDGNYNKMKCREVRYYLNEYLAGKLIDEIRTEISGHLDRCYSCRKKAAELKLTLHSSGTLRKEIHQGGELWEGVSEFNENDPALNLNAILYSPLRRREDQIYKIKLRRRILCSRWIAVGAPLGAVLAAILISVFYFSKTPPAFWQVETLKGSPVAGDKIISDSGILPAGGWLKTDIYSGARLKTGMAGEMDVDPGAELQLVSTKENDYKVYLKYGRLYVKIWAPANLLSLIIPSAYVIDKGGTYTIEVDKSGSSSLHVITGNIIISSGTDKEIIPAGAVCETMKNRNPGTPYFLNTSPAFKAALSVYDFGNRSLTDLDKVIQNAGINDAMSLWYLLRDAPPEGMEAVYNKLAELVPPPAGVTLDGIKKGDNNMLFMWWDRLGCGSKSLWDSAKG